MSLKINKVTVNYPSQSFTFDLEIPTNQKVAIIGESGSGKSTLLNTIAGFTKIDQGKIIFNNTDITNTTVGKRGVSFVFQDNNNFPHLSILANVCLAFLNSNVSKEEAKFLAMESLAKLGIKDIAHKLPHQCSGGQLQRASLARALLFTDKILLLDEPFSALDKENRLILASHLAKINDKTIIVITHNIEDVESFVDRVITISQGTITNDFLLEKK